MFELLLPELQNYILLFLSVDAIHNLICTSKEIKNIVYNSKLYQIIDNLLNNKNIYDILSTSLSAGETIMLDWMICNNITLPPIYDIVNTALGNGHLYIIKWLKKNNIRFDYSDKLLHTACYGGHLHVLQYIYNLDPEHYPHDYGCVLNTACDSSNDIQILKWFVEKKLPLSFNSTDDNWLLDQISERGKLDILIWLKNQKYIFHDVISYYESAIRGNKLDCVQWFENNFKFMVHKSTAIKFLLSNSITMIEYAIEKLYLVNISEFRCDEIDYIKNDIAIFLQTKNIKIIYDIY